MTKTKLEICTDCKGKGFVLAEYIFRISDFGKNQFERVSDEEVCDKCEGKGKING